MVVLLLVVCLNIVVLVKSSDEYSEYDKDTRLPYETEEVLGELLTEQNRTSEAAATRTSVAKGTPDGPFYRFIVGICNAMLTTFKPKKYKSYFIILGKSLKNLGSGAIQRVYLKRFASRLRYYSIFHSNVLKRKVKEFLKTINAGHPALNKYISALDKVFINKFLKLSDYVYAVKVYGKRKSRRIRRYTRDVLKKLIFGTIHVQSTKRVMKLKKLFQDALLEYIDNYKTLF